MTATRLEGIEQRAHKLGWDYSHKSDSPVTVTLDTTDFFIVCSPKAAERLLALYEPGPVVEVLEDGIGQRYIVGIKKVPKGTYKLVKVEDGDGTG